MVDSGARVDGHHRGDVRRIVVLPGSGTGTGAGVGSVGGAAAQGTSVCQALTASMDGEVFGGRGGCLCMCTCVFVCVWGGGGGVDVCFSFPFIAPTHTHLLCFSWCVSSLTCIVVRARSVFSRRQLLQLLLLCVI